MLRLVFAMLALNLVLACQRRQPLESSSEKSGVLDETAPPPEIIIIEKPIEVKPEPLEIPPDLKPQTPPPMIFVKAAEKYNEYCSFAKKLETTDTSIKLTTENFNLRLDTLNVDSLQCLVTLEVTVAKGKRFVPVVLPQSYFAALGMLTSGQFVQIDFNLITLAGDSIEASLEYQATAAGPIGNDTEFVRSLQLLRRISPPCQTADNAQRILVLLIVLTLNKGTALAIPTVMTRDIPRIEYQLENCV